jgi:hypothetical protein
MSGFDEQNCVLRTKKELRKNKKNEEEGETLRLRRSLFCSERRRRRLLAGVSKRQKETRLIRLGALADRRIGPLSARRRDPYLTFCFRVRVLLQKPGQKLSSIRPRRCSAGFPALESGKGEIKKMRPKKRDRFGLRKAVGLTPENK